jgi:hypothetical protein
VKNGKYKKSIVFKGLFKKYILKRTSKDALIHKKIGHTFAHRFRAFGGTFVSQSSFEDTVRKETSLSIPCSQCYGDAYICGYNKCYWSCAMEGETCDSCLTKEGCTQACNKCTGFV